MRIRNIKPKFFTDIKFDGTSRDARLLYIGIWCHLDKLGVCEYNPKELKNHVFFHDDLDVKSFIKIIDELFKVGVLIKIEYKNKLYLYCPTFNKHQKFSSREVEMHREVYDYIIENKKHCTDPAQALTFSCQVGYDIGHMTHDTGSMTHDSVQNETKVKKKRSRKTLASSVILSPEEKKYYRLLEDIYLDKYPKRVGKTKGLLKLVKEIITPDDLVIFSRAIDGYIKHLQDNRTMTQYIKQFDTFATDWRDWIDYKTPKIEEPIKDTYTNYEP